MRHPTLAAFAAGLPALPALASLEPAAAINRQWLTLIHCPRKLEFPAENWAIGRLMPINPETTGFQPPENQAYSADTGLKDARLPR